MVRDCLDDRLEPAADAWLAAISIMESFRPKCIGTAIGITPDLLVTAQHVAVLGKSTKEGLQVEIRCGSSRTRGIVRHADASIDLAVIQLEEPIAKPAVFLLGMDRSLAEQARRIMALGFPVASGRADRLEKVTFEPHHFDYATSGYTITAKTGLDQGFSGGPFVLMEHEETPVVGLTQNGGKVAHTHLRHATNVIEYLWSKGIRPKILPAWELEEDAVPTPDLLTQRWQRTLGLGAVHAHLNPRLAREQIELQFRLLPMEQSLPVLISTRVLTKRQFGAQQDNRVMPCLELQGNLQKFLDHIHGFGLRLPTHAEWQNAFRFAGDASPRPWPQGHENTDFGEVPAYGQPGPYGIEMPPPGHWELVMGGEGVLEAVAPPLSASEPVRRCAFRPDTNQKAVVLRLCMDLPPTESQITSLQIRWGA